MTIEEEFDKKFVNEENFWVINTNENPKIGEYPFQMVTPDEVKAFILKVIKQEKEALAKSMIGKELEPFHESGKTIEWELGYNQKRQECIEEANKQGLNI